VIGGRYSVIGESIANGGENYESRKLKAETASGLISHPYLSLSRISEPSDAHNRWRTFNTQRPTLNIEVKIFFRSMLDV